MSSLGGTGGSAPPSGVRGGAPNFFEVLLYSFAIFVGFFGWIDSLLSSFAVWYCSSFVLLLAAIVVRSELFNLGFCIFLFFELFVCCCVYNDWKG